VWHIIIGSSGQFSVAFGLHVITNEQLNRCTWNIVHRWIINVLPYVIYAFFYQMTIVYVMAVRNFEVMSDSRVLY
jgi:hypothetical protein